MELSEDNICNTADIGEEKNIENSEHNVDELTYQDEVWQNDCGYKDTSTDDYDTEDEELDDEDTQELNSELNDDLRGLIGLQNLGNTCYMNGALQALSNCQQLTRFVLDCPAFLSQKGLCRSYSELMREIWGSNRSSYAVPTSIIRNIKCIYPAFRGCSQQDTQEFLRCFLEQLHDELKQPVKNTKRQSSQNQDGDQHENNSENSQRSIISDTFEFKISSSVVCSSCNNVSTTKETFKDLSIPIPSRDHPYYHTPTDGQPTMETESELSSELASRGCDTSSSDETSPTTLLSNKTDTIDASENQVVDNRIEIQRSFIIDPLYLAEWFWSWLSYFNTWFWGPQVTLQDCLSIFFGSDPLEGDNEYSCEVCTKKNRGVKYLKILELPEVLCIHFKRYESVGSAKINTHVSFPMTDLDLAPFMSENSRPQCTTYNLIACICHHGSALMNGHYTTYALNCYDDQWYEFDDQHVTNVQEYQVENSEAYILFYQKSTRDRKTDRQRVKASRLLRKSMSKRDMNKYFISKQWVNKFNTFIEPGPITNHDFLCEHYKVPKSRQSMVTELCHPISESVWRYLKKLHGGGPTCQELTGCDICE